MARIDDEIEALKDEAEDRGLEVNDIAVAGVVKDRYGNTWAIPAEEDDDLSNYDPSGPFGKIKYDPTFHYQLERAENVTKKKSEGFVVCTLEELGLEAFTVPGAADHGTPTTSVFHQIDAVMMKIPKVLADRRQKRKEQVAREVREAIEPTEEMLSRAGLSGGRKTRPSEAIAEAQSQGMAASVTRKSTVGPAPEGDYVRVDRRV